NAFTVVTDLGSIVRTRGQGIRISQRRTARGRRVPNYRTRGSVRVQVSNRRHIDFAEYLLKLGQRRGRLFINGNRYRCQITRYVLTTIGAVTHTYVVRMVTCSQACYLQLTVSNRIGSTVYDISVCYRLQFISIEIPAELWVSNTCSS